MQRKFSDRFEAGQVLAAQLQHYADRPDAIVLALPRGGVPVGFKVASALNLPLDVFIVRKIGVPGHEELAMGAIASGGVRILNDDVIGHLGISKEAIDRMTRREAAELQRRELEYRDDCPLPPLTNKTVILVDDGLATGSTMRAAVGAIRQQRPARLVVAVPVAAEQTCEELRSEVDEMVCAMKPEPFHAVGLWYEDFSQTTDDEVRDLLGQAARNRRDRHPSSAARS